MANSVALNRQVVGSIPTASTIESSTHEHFLYRLRRTSPNCSRPLRISSFQSQSSNRRRPAFEHSGRARIHGIENTLFDGLHVYVSGRLNASVTQHALRVLQRSVLLHIRAQRSPHHLKGDKAVRDSTPLGNGNNSPLEKVLSPTRYRLALPFPTPEGGEHQSLR